MSEVEPETEQVRMNRKAATVMKRLAAARGQSMNDLTLEWLLPLAERELARQLQQDLDKLKKKESP